MSVDTDLEKLRLRIGDTQFDAQGNGAIFKDAELNYIIASESTLEAQALLAFRMAAAKYARHYDFETDGQRFWRNQQVKAFLDLAKDLEAKGVTTSTDPSAVSTVAVTKVDGYSQDVPNDDVTVTARRLRYDDDFDVVP